MPIKNKQLAIMSQDDSKSIPSSFAKDRVSIDDNMKNSVIETLISGAWSMFTSPEVATFEQEFAAYVGAEEAVLLNSCTNAIYAAILATKPKPGAKIAVPAYTYIGTCMPVLAAGCIPVFVDIEKSGQSISFEHFDEIVKKEEIHAVIHAHLFGNVNLANAKKIIQLCKVENVHYIADCAQFIGIQKITAFLSKHGFCCFSFGESKILRVGEGGAVTTSMPDSIDSIRLVRHEGEKWKNKNVSRITNWSPSPKNIIYDLECVTVGLNFRPLALIATIARIQLGSITTQLAKIKNNAEYLFQELLSNETIQLPYKVNRIWWTFPVIVKHKYFTRDEILAILLSEGIPVGVHFPKLMLEHEILGKYGNQCDYQTAIEFSENHLVLPIYPMLGIEHMQEIVAALDKINHVKTEDLEIIRKRTKELLRDSEVDELCNGLFIFLKNDNNR